METLIEKYERQNGGFVGRENGAREVELYLIMFDLA